MGCVRRDVLVIERMVSQLEACLNNNFSSFNSIAYKNYQKAADYSVAVVSSEYFVFSPENTEIQVNQLDRGYITQAHTHIRVFILYGSLCLLGSYILLIVCRQKDGL